MTGRWANLRAAKALRAYFAKKDSLSQRELAARLELKSESAVYFWKIGFRRPEPMFRAAIERLTGISAAWWLTADEKDRAKKLRAA